MAYQFVLPARSVPKTVTVVVSEQDADDRGTGPGARAKVERRGVDVARAAPPGPARGSGDAMPTAIATRWRRRVQEHRHRRPIDRASSKERVSRDSSHLVAPPIHPGLSFKLAVGRRVESDAPAYGQKSSVCLVRKRRGAYSFPVAGRPLTSVLISESMAASWDPSCRATKRSTWAVNAVGRRRRPRAAPPAGLQRDGLGQADDLGDFLERGSPREPSSARRGIPSIRSWRPCRKSPSEYASARPRMPCSTSRARPTMW